jgi:hypothetical protein
MTAVGRSVSTLIERRYKDHQSHPCNPRFTRSPLLDLDKLVEFLPNFTP